MRPEGGPQQVDAAARLRAARDALYRPGAGPDAVARFEALRSRAPGRGAVDEPAAVAAVPEPGGAGDRTAADPPPLTPGGPLTSPPVEAAGASRRRLVAWSAAALAVGVVGGVLLGTGTRAATPLPGSSTAPPSAQQQVVQRVVGSGGSLAAQDYFRLYPDDLPIQWGGASTGVAFRRLSGDETVPVRPARDSSTLLIVVGCPPDDGRYVWTLRERGVLTSIAGGHGACGRLEGDLVQLPTAARGADLRLDTGARGPGGYSVTVLER